jgi:pimeloyl-ACP methyl ester carboxylesterase
MKKKSLIFLAVLSLLICIQISHAGADSIKLSNGLDMFYKSAGEGQIPIILVHGYSLSSSAWDKVLNKFPPKYKVFAIDLRGFGKSGKPVNGYTYMQMSKDLSLFMDSIKTEKAILIGHSLGSNMLQHFAVNHPQKILSLILSNSYAMNVDPAGISEGVKKRLDSYGTKEENRKVFESTMPTYFSKDNLSPGDIEKFVEIGVQSSTDALRGMLEETCSVPKIPNNKFQSIHKPTLIVVGTRDTKYATFEKAVAINEGIPNSKIFIVEYSGHTPMWEKPETWLKGVLSFLGENE